MQEFVTVKGMVMLSQPIGEADRRIVLLTKELGRISCFARGARKPTNTLCGCTRAFMFGTFYLYQSRDSYSLQKAEITEYFEEIVMDVSKTAYGSYFMELAAYFSRENMDGGEMLNLMYLSLRTLAAGKISGRLIRRIYELRILTMNGLLPELYICAKCGREPEHGFFKPGLLRMVCSDCEQDGVWPLGRSAIHAIRHIQTAPLRSLFSFNLTPEVLQELSHTVEPLLSRHVDRKLSSKDLLEVLTDD